MSVKEKKKKMKSNKTKFKEQVLKDLATKKEDKIMQYFAPCISCEQINFFFDYYLTKKDRKRFNEWMFGATCPLGGYYPWDILAFFQGRKPLD